MAGIKSVAGMWQEFDVTDLNEKGVSGKSWKKRDSLFSSLTWPVALVASH